MIPFRIHPEKHETIASAWELEHMTKAEFTTPVPLMVKSVASSISAMETGLMSAISSNYPNRMFASAIDLNSLKKDIMAMDHHRLNAEELDDQEAFMALSNDVISDLLDDEPDIYTIDDVKVRFR